MPGPEFNPLDEIEPTKEEFESGMSALSRNRVLEMVGAERVRQDGKWGGAAHDDTHSSSDWARFIAKRLDMVTGPISPEQRRQLWTEIAALAVAATESNFRNEG